MIRRQRNVESDTDTLSNTQRERYRQRDIDRETETERQSQRTRNKVRLTDRRKGEKRVEQICPLYLWLGLNG